VPNRILRDWTDSYAVNALDAFAERFFVRLIMKADDYGRFHADPRLLKANLFPLLPEIRDTDISHWLAACEKAGMVRCYEDGRGRRFLEIQNFRQRTRQSESKFPAPPSPGRPDGEVQPRDGPQPDDRQADDGQLTVNGQPDDAQAPDDRQADDGQLRTETETYAETETDARASASLSPFEVYRSVYGADTHIYHQEIIEAAGIDDLDLWRECVTDWKTNHYSERNISGLIKSYRQRKERQDKKQRENGADETAWRPPVVVAPPDWGRGQPREGMPDDARALLPKRRTP